MPNPNKYQVDLPKSNKLEDKLIIDNILKSETLTKNFIEFLLLKIERLEKANNKEPKSKFNKFTQTNKDDGWKSYGDNYEDFA